MKSDFLLQGPSSAHRSPPFASLPHVSDALIFTAQFKSKVCLENKANIATSVPRYVSLSNGGCSGCPASLVSAGMYRINFTLLSQRAAIANDTTS